MAIYDDGTMDVLKDGKVEQRKYERSDRRPFINSVGVPFCVQPILNDGEDVAYFGGASIPHIVRVQWPTPERNGTLIERLRLDKLGREIEDV